jgi:hypothetical protein
VPQAGILDVLGRMPRFCEDARQPGRELRIDEKAIKSRDL